ncbi:hypothetical protein FACS189490_13180 [Clostridia bacterium]|nr:hypothetical protein FACS189490_13180 [Clostridia bacterium]
MKKIVKILVFIIPAVIIAFSLENNYITKASAALEKPVQTEIAKSPESTEAVSVSAAQTSPSTDENTAANTNTNAVTPQPWEVVPSTSEAPSPGGDLWNAITNPTPNPATDAPAATAPTANVTPTETPYVDPIPTAQSGTESASETPAPTAAPLVTVTNPYFSDYGSAYNTSGTLKNDTLSWWFNPNETHQPPTAAKDFDIRQFDGYYLGDITQKVIYLTFDEGYENGYTPMILDVLKKTQVPAAFVVTKPFQTENPALIKRMVNEGHIVANHSVNHKSSPSLSDEELKYELTENAKYFTSLTGLEMPLFFRPPMGEYSARTLSVTKSLGYKSVFWSFAHRDWLVDDQPGKVAAYNTITSRVHPGAVILLHAVSESNTYALEDVIGYLFDNGYTFKTLYDLPSYQ